MMYKACGRKPDGLKGKPEMSMPARDIWELYIEIKKGSETLTYKDIESFMNVTGEVLSPFEISVIIDCEIERRNG